MSKPSASAEAASYNASISSCERSSSLIRLSLLIEDRDHLDRQAVAHLPGFAEEFRSLSDLHEKGLVHTRVQLQHIAHPQLGEIPQCDPAYAHNNPRTHPHPDQALFDVARESAFPVARPAAEYGLGVQMSGHGFKRAIGITRIHPPLSSPHPQVQR